MSKARQRRISAFSLGRRDAQTGCGFRWARHPQIEDYRAGYLSAKPQRQKYPAWLEWLLRLFVPNDEGQPTGGNEGTRNDELHEGNTV